MARILSSNLPLPGSVPPAGNHVSGDPATGSDQDIRRRALHARFGTAPQGTDLEAPASDTAAAHTGEDCAALP